jgi:CRISPR/Cas system-associated exonuclease Cas4 (RecB family)
MANFSYDKVPEDGDFSDWATRHTRLLREIAGDEERKGASLTIEGQNTFRYRLSSGLVLHGKPDLVSTYAGRTTVIEAKTTVPRNRDLVQVKLYMYGLRECHPRYSGIELDGLVVYPDGHRIPVPSEAVDDEFVDNVHYWLELIENTKPARKVPSEENCRFCKIGTRDCSDRMAASSEPAE